MTKFEKVSTGIGVVINVVSAKKLSAVYQEYYMELFLETLSCQDLRVKARALYDTRSAGA